MALGDLAPVFTLRDARSAGVRKDQVYDMIGRGEVERIGRGVFAQVGTVDPTLAVLASVAAVQPAATLCLASALVHHSLSDQIPFGTDVALPRGVRHPAGFEHVTWHSYAVATFDVGRLVQDAGGMRTSIYSAERTIVDCFRLMHQEGSASAHEALRRWLARRGNSPAVLLRTAAPFPQALPRLRFALEALL